MKKSKSALLKSPENSTANNETTHAQKEIELLKRKLQEKEYQDYQRLKESLAIAIRVAEHFANIVHQQDKELAEIYGYSTSNAYSKKDKGRVIKLKF